MTTEQRHETAQPTPGTILKTAREQRGLSQQDVAHRLNLRISLIRDIEEDRFDQKTASTFTRGYLKTYARFVGADEKAVVAAYDSLGLDDKKYSEMYSFSGRTQREASEHRVRLISWVLCIGLIGLGGTWWWLQPTEEPVPTSINEAGQLVVKAVNDAALAVNPVSSALSVAAESDSLQVPVIPDLMNTSSSAAPAIADVAEENDTEGQAPTVLTDTAVEADAQEQSAVVPATTSLAATSTAVATSAAVSTTASAEATAVAADPSVALQLHFSETCWLRVTDATGKSILEGTKNAGDKISLSGKEPFSLTIGAPRAVSIYFHGQEVDMSSYIRQGVVARYKLPLKN